MPTRRPFSRRLATTVLCGGASLAASLSSSTNVFTNDPRFDEEWIGNSVVELDGKIAIQDGELRSAESYSPPLALLRRVRDAGNRDGRVGWVPPVTRQ